MSWQSPIIYYNLFSSLLKSNINGTESMRLINMEMLELYIRNQFVVYHIQYQNFQFFNGRNKRIKKKYSKCVLNNRKKNRSCNTQRITYYVCTGAYSGLWCTAKLECELWKKKIYGLTPNVSLFTIFSSVLLVFFFS